MSTARGLPRQAARHAVSRYRYRRALHRLARVARSDGPIIAGPWHSEVGFELLYWIPLLRWLEQHYAIDPARVTAISRGGAEPWYADLAGNYVDLIDELSVEGLRGLRERQAAEFGCQKQLRPLAEDGELVQRVASRLGLQGPQILHPAEMFWLFRGFLAGLMSLSALRKHTVYRPIAVDADPAAAEQLPDRYVAVKLYVSSCLPDRSETREKLFALTEVLGRSSPIVLLESDLGIDEHRFFGSAPQGAVRPALAPRDNLAVQSRIIRDAELLVTTYGGFSYLGPYLGTPTVSIFTDDNFNHEHLEVMRHASAQVAPGMAASAFTVGTVDDVLEQLAAGIPTGATVA